MSNPNRDPDELAHEREMPNNNFHDEEPEIQNDEVPGFRPDRPAPRRLARRRPPPRRWDNEE